MYHANVNVNLMREKVINHWGNNSKCQCEWKNIVYVKNVAFGTLVHVFVKMENIVIIMDDLVIVCDEIIEEQILMKKKQPVKREVSIFYLHFY